METYTSGDTPIRIEQFEPATPGPHPALILLHGSGGAGRYWLDRFAPVMSQYGIAAYAPHYFDKTRTDRATPQIILDGIHFPQWLTAAKDAIGYVASRPSVDPHRIGVLGISLGGYLAVSLSATDSRVRATIELSGGVLPGWEHRLHSAMLPVLILHGEQDTVIPPSEARKLALLLDTLKVPHQVELFAGETHWFSARSQPKLLLTCAGFLQQHLRF
jgi:carboxymethylenebutenolidase